MQQLQSLKRLLFFYVLTLLIMLALYYAEMFHELKKTSQDYSLHTFTSLQHEFVEHINPTNGEVKNILDEPFFKDISYQLIFMLPSGQTHIHRYTRPGERKFTTVTFPTLNLPSTNNDESKSKSNYTLDNHTLTGIIKIESGHQLYVVLRHQPLKVDWVSYRFWLPLMTAIILFIISLLYMLNRRTAWEKLLSYTDSLSTTAKDSYSPPPFSHSKIIPEFSHLGHTLSRISYQLYSQHRRIKKLSHRLECLVDQAPLPMIMLMRHGKVSFVNQRFESLFSTSFQDDMDYQLTDFVAGNDEATQSLLEKITTLRITRILLVTSLLHKQTYQLHITPWFNEHGQVHGFTVMLNSIDKFVNQNNALKAQNQQLKRHLGEFRQLRAVISHELRPPLNDIIMVLERIDSETLSTQQLEVLKTLTQSSYSMLAMLNDTLDMTKKEAQKTHIINESVDIFKLGREVNELMTSPARRKGLELLYFFAPDCPRYIDTDSKRLQQILVSLLDNSVKFTVSGYVALIIEPVLQQTTQSKVAIDSATQATLNDIRLEKPTDSITTISNEASDKQLAPHQQSSQPHHHWIRFSVKDTGIGIKESDKQQLFSGANKTNLLTNQTPDGSGLGLAIANSFAHLLGGFIEIDNELSEGSTFNLYLPCKQPQYQPIYHFHSSLTQIHLIAVVNQSMRAAYLQRFCDHLSLPASIYSQLDETTIAQISTQLKQRSEQRATVLMLDYEYYLSEISLLSKESIVDSSLDDKKATNMLSAKQVFDEVLDDTGVPKILYSMKTERNISSTLLDKFEGFLTKPLDFGLLLSELIRLTQPLMQPVEHLPSIENVNSESTTSVNDTVEQALAPLILVVEDSVTNQKITCKLLDKLGYRSVIAEDGQQALEVLKVQRQEIALILMDCRMPVMDGLQATQAIRAQGDNIIIVALTANNSEEDREACIAVGMDEFLSKPINKAKLQAVLENVIQTQ